jgi:hypothetical protein
MLGAKVSLSKAESTHNDVIILSHTGFLEYDDLYYVCGEVQNVGSQTFSRIDISADFYDQSGAKIGNWRALANLANLQPQRISPFKIQVDDKAYSARVYRYDISVAWYEPADPLPRQLSIFELNQEYHADDLNAQIFGTFENRGDNDAHYAHVAVTYYDIDGNVLYTGFDEKDLAVSHSSANRFVIDFVGERTRLVAKYRVTLESMEYSAVHEFSTLFPVPEFPSLLMIPLLLTLLSAMLFLKKHKASDRQH